MDKRFDFALRIIAWSLLLVAIFFLFLMVLGIVHSPELELLSLFVSTAIFLEIGRLESKTSNLSELKKDVAELKSKFELVWSDFKKRKEL